MKQTIILHIQRNYATNVWLNKTRNNDFHQYQKTRLWILWWDNNYWNEDLYCLRGLTSLFSTSDVNFAIVADNRLLLACLIIAWNKWSFFLLNCLSTEFKYHITIYYKFSIKYKFLVLGNQLIHVPFTRPHSCSRVLEVFK